MSRFLSKINAAKEKKRKTLKGCEFILHKKLKGIFILLKVFLNKLLIY